MERENKKSLLMGQLHQLKTIKELTELLDTIEELRLYGAGYYLDFFLQGIEELNKCYPDKIKCIMVSNTEGNPEKIKGIPVVYYQSENLRPGDSVLLTLGHRYTEEVYDLLKGTGAVVIQIDFNIFQEAAYREVRQSLQPFLDHFPRKLSGLNQPVTEISLTAWTCWWQGEEQAPDIVKACIESQRRNIPEGVKHVVITERNYKDYITLPPYIIEKVNTESITLTTLSDMLRASLLYKYGGFWMDATLMVLEPLDGKILDDPLYTRNLPETQYCANAMWAGWFLYAKPGSQLFQFLMEGFFYYFSVHDKIKYYFMVDYIISIACNMFPEIEKQLRDVPYNNERAGELGKHLLENFEEQKYKKYTEGTTVQKLSYKLDRTSVDESIYTIYDYLIDRGKYENGNRERTDKSNQKRFITVVSV